VTVGVWAAAALMKELHGRQSRIGNGVALLFGG
jgi:hypothetical protein